MQAKAGPLWEPPCLHLQALGPLVRTLSQGPLLQGVQRRVWVKGMVQYHLDLLQVVDPLPVLDPLMGSLPCLDCCTWWETVCPLKWVCLMEQVMELSLV